jgi:hypothetical protein
MLTIMQENISNTKPSVKGGFLEAKWLLPLTLSQVLTLGALPQLVSAATIVVNDNGQEQPFEVDGDCTYTDTAVDLCTAGSGADTINLQATGTYILTYQDNYADGNNGLPSVSSQITLNGNNKTIERSGAAPNFRIFHVAATGDLTLNQITIKNGNATGSGIERDGGGIFNLGILAINNSTLSGNNAVKDGGGLKTMLGLR